MSGERRLDAGGKQVLNAAGELVLCGGCSISTSSTLTATILGVDAAKCTNCADVGTASQFRSITSLNLDGVYALTYAQTIGSNLEFTFSPPTPADIGSVDVTDDGACTNVLSGGSFTRVKIVVMVDTDCNIHSSYVEVEAPAYNDALAFSRPGAGSKIGDSLVNILSCVQYGHASSGGTMTLGVA